MPRAERTPIELLAGGVCLVLAIVCVQSFHALGWAYDHFVQPAAGGVRIPPPELAFDLLYLAYGSTAAACLVAALRLCRADAPLVAASRRAARWRALPAVLVVLVVAGAWVARRQVLDRLPVADDEEVYLFIGRTLLAGGVTDSSALEEEFWSDEFIVRGANGRFGKYPVGHGAVLALAFAARAVDLVGPLLAGLTACLTWFVARRSVGRRRALAATALLALSPHFVLTHATLLSQTTSAAALMATLACLTVWRGKRRRGAREAPWLLAAGAALAFGCLTRPLPGALFAAVAAAAVAAPLWRSPAAAARALALLGAPLAAGAFLLGAVHALQTGSPLLSGYHLAHGGLGILSGPPGVVAASLFAAVVRENFWLFGWPMSLAPLAFARPRRGRLLLWGPVVAVLAYRILVPKIGVSTTGPVYMLETVPPLAILAADGLARLAASLRRLRGPATATVVPACVAAAFVVSFAIFVPVETASVRRGAAVRGRVYELLARRGADRALVFANELVVARSGASWARRPPIPSPSLDEKLLFLRLPPGPAGRARATALWRQRFADRPAFVFDPRPPVSLRPLVRRSPPP